jgi:4-amino-4-deoxy-L-arabinose transferase-like glycosyltransferase
MKKSTTVIIFAVLIFCIFAFLRFSHIYSVPVFVDEAIYVRWSQVMRAEASLRFLPMSDGKQPLFMWATIPFFKLISDPLVAARTLSSLSGLGSAFGLAILSQLFFGNLTVSLLTAALYSILPFTVFFDRMALVDSLLAMFGVWSLVFFKKFLDRRSLDWAMLTGIAIGAGLLTKSPAIIYYLWIFLLTFFTLKPQKENKKSLMILVIGAFYILVISQGLNAILKLGPNSAMAGSRNLDYVYTFKEVLSHPQTPIVGNLKTVWRWLWVLLTPTALIGIFLSYKISDNKKYFYLLLLCSLLPLLGLSSIAKVFTSRYILFAVYPLIPLAALGLSKLKPVLLYLLLAIPLTLSLWNIYAPASAPLPYDMASGYYRGWTSGWGQKEIASYLIDLQSQGKKSVVFTEGFFGTLPDGLQIYTQSYPDITVVGSDPIAKRLPEGLLGTSKTNERFFVINSSRNMLEPTDLAKLELIKEYPKFKNEDGTFDSLQFFKLK